MKTKGFIFLMIIFPTIILAQTFPAPARTQINNRMMLGEQLSQQHKQMAPVLQNNIRTYEKKLDKEQQVKLDLEEKISSLKSELAQLKSANAQSEDNLDKKEVRYSRMIEKMTEKLKVSNNKIADLESKIKNAVEKLKVELNQES